MVLILNFGFYLVWLSYTLYKEKRFTIYSILLSLYTLIALLGIYTVHNGIYFETFGRYDVNSLEITPYILCAASFVLLLSPLQGVTMNTSNITIIASHKASLLVRCWVIYFLPFTIIKIGESIVSLSTGMADVYDAVHNEGEALFVYSNYFIRKYNDLGQVMLDTTTPFIMLYAIIGMYTKYISQAKSSTLMVLCFLPSLARSLAGGSRGSMFMVFFCFLFFILLFWKYIPKSYVKKIFVIFISFLSAILSYSWLITVSRYGDKSNNNGFDSILRYFGEPFPNLGFSFWGKAKYHPMGQRLFPGLISSNESHLIKSVGDRHDYWVDKTGLPIHTFKTIFGDLYIEYGAILALIFMITLAFFMKRILKHKKITIYTIPIAYFYYQICVYAFGGYSKGGTTALFQMVFIALFIVFLKFYLPLKKHNDIKHSDTSIR